MILAQICMQWNLHTHELQTHLYLYNHILYFITIIYADNSSNDI